jgi:hypothetical protein
MLCADRERALLSHAGSCDAAGQAARSAALSPPATDALPVHARLRPAVLLRRHHSAAAERQEAARSDLSAQRSLHSALSDGGSHYAAVPVRFSLLAGHHWRGPLVAPPGTAARCVVYQ